MTSIYPAPTWQLMLEAFGDSELPNPFTTVQMVGWFAKKYPKISDQTVRLHLRGMSVNVPAAYLERWPDDRRVFYKIDRVTYVRFDPALHGEWDHGMPTQDMSDVVLESASTTGAEIAPTTDAARFVLESHLEDFMAGNWAKLDFGAPITPIVDETGAGGRQFQTDIGRIDFLCRDASTNDFWILELKRGRASDQVVGQVLRYMGWVKQNLAGEHGVRGLIIGHSADDQLRYALQMVPNVEAWTYEVSFTFNREAAAV